MTVCAVQAHRYARARRLDRHRAGALRLFALSIGSWLYRMDYGFWLLLVGDVGHTDNFQGIFDRCMDFPFYLPNLVVVQVYLRGRPTAASTRAQRLAAATLVAATAFLYSAPASSPRRSGHPRS